jgi:RNA polymerase sigma-70 factor (sigma-E family)
VDFEAFVAARGDGLLRFAYLLCRDLGRSEDLVQEALFKAYRVWERTGAVEWPEAYVRRIVLTEYLGWRRRRLSREIVGLPVGEVIVSDGVAQLVDRDAVWRLMGDLPARQRAVLVLRYYEDLPDEEIAGVMGCPQATVRSLARRALTTLRARSATTAPSREGKP